MGVRTGDRVEICRAVRRAVRRDDCTAIESYGRLYGRLQNVPSILVLRVSRALELRIGLRVKLRAELQAELQGGEPLGPPC